jgi:hypothetical protein
MLHVLDTALNPIAIASFLGADVGPFLTARARARFAGEGDDVVGNWRPLEAATQAIRASGRSQGLWNVGDAHPINRRTGDMEAFITSTGFQISPVTIGATLTFPGGTPDTEMQEKIKTAQQGKADPKTPARPVLAVGIADMNWVLLALASHIKKTRITV